MSDNNSSRMNMRKTKVFLLIIVVFVLLAAGVFYMQRIRSQNNETVDTGKVSYSDPANHFTLSVPRNWVIKSDFGSQTTGLGTDHEKVSRIEATSFFAEGVGINITITEELPVCDSRLAVNTTVAGLPAYYDEGHYSWIIKTTDSTINIAYYYPGAGVYHRRGMAEQFISEQEKLANMKLIEQIVSTLKFSNAKPLGC